MQRRDFMRSGLAGIVGAGLAGRGLAAESGTDVDIEKYRAAAVESWEHSIATLEDKDKTETYPDDSILFVGSSSIRLWDDIAADMAPYPVIQRGYGGAKWSDVAIFADRLITPHTFRAAVFFVGNDISGRKGDKSPDEVVALFAHVLETLRAHNPMALVFYIAVTPTSSRWSVWPEIKAANSAIREFCQSQENTYFIGTESIYLNSEGKPRDELFRDDRLHLNRAGYIRWAAAIQSQLDSVLDGA